MGFLDYSRTLTMVGKGTKNRSVIGNVFVRLANTSTFASEARQSISLRRQPKTQHMLRYIFTALPRIDESVGYTEEYNDELSLFEANERIMANFPFDDIHERKSIQTKHNVILKIPTLQELDRKYNSLLEDMLKT